MSFPVELGRLLKLVDAGVPVAEAGAAVGIERWRAYALLSAAGRGVGRPKTRINDELRDRVIEGFAESGTVSAAAAHAGLSQSAARKILVTAGLVPAGSRRGKAAARTRFLELIEQGWSTAPASREVGVHPRTGRDWRSGIRKVGNTRVHPDGTVVDYRTGTRYPLGHEQCTRGDQ